MTQTSPPPSPKGDLATMVQGLTGEVAVLNTNMEREQKKSRRTRIALVLTVLSLCFDIGLTIFLKGVIDTTNRNSQTQYASCLQANKSRETLRTFFDGIWEQNLQQTEANPQHLPPAQIAQYVTIIKGYQAKTDASFSTTDCSKLRH